MPKKTTNYSRFCLPSWNRDVDENHVQALAKSMEKSYAGEAYPISVRRTSKGKLMISDGQHRFLAAKELGLPVYYTELKKGTITADQARIAGRVTRKWSLYNVLSSWSGRKKKPYVFLKNLLEEKELSKNFIKILSGCTTKEFEEGKMTFSDSDKEDILEFIDFYKEVEKLVGDLGSAGAKALWDMFDNENFSETRMLTRLNRYPNKYRKYTSFDDAYDCLTSIYNYRTKKSDCI